MQRHAAAVEEARGDPRGCRRLNGWEGPATDTPKFEKKVWVRLTELAIVDAKAHEHEAVRMLVRGTKPAQRTESQRLKAYVGDKILVGATGHNKRVRKPHGQALKLEHFARVVHLTHSDAPVALAQLAHVREYKLRNGAIDGLPQLAHKARDVAKLRDLRA